MSTHAQLVARLLTPVIRRASSAHVAGADLGAALEVAERLMTAGYDVTLGYWSRADQSPAEVWEEYHQAVDAVQQWGRRGGVAVKAPAVAFGRAGVPDLARQAASADVPLAFDAHSVGDVDRSFELAVVAAAAGAPTAVAIATRWRRSLQDVDTAAREGLMLRLVKGQWRDVDSAPTGEKALRASFLAVLDRAVSLQLPISLATHDAALLDEALSRLAGAGGAACVELLLGLRSTAALTVAARHRAAVRFYVPYGHPSLTFSLARMVRRPRLAANLAEALTLGKRHARVRQREALRFRVPPARRPE